MAEPQEKVVTCVCTGNVCRSPMAAALLRHALQAEDAPLNQLEVVSAGVAARHGEPASDNAGKALKKVGLDLKDHRSQPLSDELVERSLVIFCMTDSHRKLLREFYPEMKDTPVLLFREPMEQTTDTQVPDPFGGHLAIYEHTRDALVEAIPAIIKYLKGRLATDTEPGTSD